MEKKNSSSDKMPPYPTGGTFGELLEWHLQWGTRPKCSISERNTPWKVNQFAVSIHEPKTHLNTAKQTLANWRKGTIPDLDDDVTQLKVEKLFQALFDKDPKLSGWESELRAALQSGREAQQARIKLGKRANAAPVPRPTTHFLGRKDEVKAIAAQLSSKMPRISLLVQGGPGVGKTELTKAVAHHPSVVEQFGERRWFIDLQTVGTADGVKDAISRAIGSTGPGGFQVALNILEKQPGLLVLDNLETPWDPIAERDKTSAVLAALDNVPGLTMLASYRGFDQEDSVRWKTYPVNGLSRRDSISLFVSIGGEGISDDPRLDDFINALGGIPLALNLVAHRARNRKTLEPLWREWKRIGSDFAKRQDRATGPLTSLTHSIELSLSSPRVAPYRDAIRLFSLLGCLPAGIRPDDRDTLIGTDTYDAEDCLLSAGLAIEREGRIDLLPPIRAYARHHRKPEGQDAVRWTDHYLAITRSVATRINDRSQEDLWERLRIEFYNIEAALREGFFQSRRAEAISSLEDFGLTSRLVAMRTAIFEELASACLQQKDTEGFAVCLLNSGVVELFWQENEQAKVAFRRARRAFMQIGNVAAEIRCVSAEAYISFDGGDYNAGKHALDEAISLCRRAKMNFEELDCLIASAASGLISDDLETARTIFQSVRHKSEKIGHLSARAQSFRGLGWIAYQENDYDNAEMLFESAEAMGTLVANSSIEGLALKGLGAVLLRLGNDQEAKASFIKAKGKFAANFNVAGFKDCDVCLEVSDRVALARATDQVVTHERYAYLVEDLLGKPNHVDFYGWWANLINPH